VRFEVFTAVKIQVEFFWVVMPYSAVVEYQRFRGPCCLHLQDEEWASMDLRKVAMLPQHWVTIQ